MGINNLPLFSNRSTGSMKSSIGVGHAQDFTTSRLNSRKEIDDAKVSINEVGYGQRPTTSINRLNSNNLAPSTSISHSAVPQTVGAYNEDEADDKRYNYIRRLAIARRKEREALESEKDVYDLGIKSGALFTGIGPGSIKRKLARLQKTNPAVFKNLGKEDRAYFAGLVGRYAGKVRAGDDFSIRMKKQMTMEVEKKRRAGEITSADSADMKGMIKNLPHT